MKKLLIIFLFIILPVLIWTGYEKMSMIDNEVNFICFCAAWCMGMGFLWYLFTKEKV